MSDVPDLLDVHGAAQVAGRTAETIRRWIWSGKLPAERRGRKLFVVRTDVIRLTTGPVVEVGGLAQWHAAALARADAGVAERTEFESAADLVLEDRWSRDSAKAPDSRR